MEEETKSVEFKHISSDGTIDLGVPERITVEKGNYRDGGCNLKFKTSPLSIGIGEKFSLYLFSDDINDVTRKIWKGYAQTEPASAKRDIESVIEFLENLQARM